MQEFVSHLAGLLLSIGFVGMIYGLLKLQTDRYNERKKGDDG